VRFVDTNVLLYAITTAEDEREKSERARKILEARDLALSVQVLQEFYVQATRPSKLERVTHEQAAALIDSWMRFRIEELTVALLQSVLSTRLRWNSPMGMPPSSRRHGPPAAEPFFQRTFKTEWTSAGSGCRTRFAESRLKRSRSGRPAPELSAPRSGPHP